MGNLLLKIEKLQRVQGTLSTTFLHPVKLSHKEHKKNRYIINIINNIIIAFNSLDCSNLRLSYSYNYQRRVIAKIVFNIK